MKEKISAFFGKIKEFYTSDETKKKAFIITGSVAAAIIVAIILIVPLNPRMYFLIFVILLRMPALWVRTIYKKK